MRDRAALVLATALATSCGAAAHPAEREAPPERLSYVVHLDDALRAMRVTVCPARAERLPSALDATSEEARRHVRGGRLVIDGRDGAVLDALPFDLRSAPPDACVRYDVDLGACDAPTSSTDCARLGSDLFAPAATWLLAPALRSTRAHYDLRFELPEGVHATPIGEAEALDPSRVVLDERNFAFVTYLAFVHDAPRTIEAPGACIDLVSLGEVPLGASFDAQAHWLRAATSASARVTGAPPFDRLTALVVTAPDVPSMPVLFGVAGRGQRSTVTLFVSQHASEASLVADWTAVHELSHFLTAHVENEDVWLSEGLATYYEEVLRAREGTRTETQAWEALVDGFDRGRAAHDAAEPLDEVCRTMRVTRSFTRVYWEGAALVFLADVAYRRTGSSLDEAVARAWPHRGERTSAAQLIAWLDGADDGVFARIAREGLASRSFPDVESALAWLGVTRQAGRIVLSDEAPGAEARRALMNGVAPATSNPVRCPAASREAAAEESDEAGLPLRNHVHNVRVPA